MLYILVAIVPSIVILVKKWLMSTTMAVSMIVIIWCVEHQTYSHSRNHDRNSSCRNRHGHGNRNSNSNSCMDSLPAVRPRQPPDKMLLIATRVQPRCLRQVLSHELFFVCFIVAL